MRCGIIGAGEIGKSLYKVLKDAHEVVLKDKEEANWDNIEVLNICYPYSESFVKTTKEYINKYNPKVTIIHSTVSPGTTRLCGENVVHSPCHGKHPNLEQGMRTFVKYVGGTKTSAVILADRFLRQAGVKTQIVSNAETSEISKIACTTYYGWNIVFMKEMEKYCDKMGVPFHEVYTQWNMHYDMGYSNLGMPQYVRPVLEPVAGGIGGHCVFQNTFLWDSLPAKLVNVANKTYLDSSLEVEVSLKGGENEKRHLGKRDGGVQPSPVKHRKRTNR